MINKILTLAIIHGKIENTYDLNRDGKSQNVEEMNDTTVEDFEIMTRNYDKNITSLYSFGNYVQMYN